MYYKDSLIRSVEAYACSVKLLRTFLLFRGGQDSIRKKRLQLLTNCTDEYTRNSSDNYLTSRWSRNMDLGEARIVI